MPTKQANIRVLVTSAEKDDLVKQSGPESVSNHVRKLLGLVPLVKGRMPKRSQLMKFYAIEKTAPNGYLYDVYEVGKSDSSHQLTWQQMARAYKGTTVEIQKADGRVIVQEF